MANYQTILYERNNWVALITLNRPERRNAITNAMLSELMQAFKNAQEDAAVRAILLTGAGKGFCAGQDLQDLPRDMGDNYIYEHLATRYNPLIALIRGIEKPIIAAINGIAAGAGASLALACDLRIMADDASLLQAFSNIGLIPDSGSTWFLVRQVGYSRAFELTIEGERIPASRCLELGLTNRVVAAESLLNEARSWAEKLARRATYAIGLTKRAMNKAMTSTLMDAMETEAQLQQLASESQDFVEGMKAFQEKRPPVFQGR